LVASSSSSSSSSAAAAAAAAAAFFAFVLDVVAAVAAAAVIVRSHDDVGQKGPALGAVAAERLLRHRRQYDVVQLELRRRLRPDAGQRLGGC
jgi:hypothetical protein